MHKKLWQKSLLYCFVALMVAISLPIKGYATEIRDGATPEPTALPFADPSLTGDTSGDIDESGGDISYEDVLPEEAENTEGGDGSNKVFLPLIVGAGAGLDEVTDTPLPIESRAAGNPIALENQKPGNPTWQESYFGQLPPDDTVGQILGYTSATSVNKGGSIDLHVSVNPPQPYTIRIFRMGWYGGDGGRLMQEVGPLDGITQPPCPQDATTGLTECQWTSGYTLNVPTDWTTGVYLVVLDNSSNYHVRFTFVVRDDGRVADFLYQQPVTTYQAYNNYPNNGTTGKSLYDYNSFGANTASGNRRAVKVSFDRPRGDQFEYFEIYFVRWAERMGYDISYTTDIDTHLNGARLLNYKGVISSGHDEYWTKEMFDAFEKARDQGVNLAFLGANAAYWQTRLEPSSRNVANRVMVSYKNAALDPIADPARKTDQFRYLGRPEQTLIGVQYTADGNFEVGQPYIVQNSYHWLWEKTGFTNGTVVPGLTGYEIDRSFSNYPAPVSRSYTLLARSPYVANGSVTFNNNDISESSIYQAPSRAWVFATGTLNWSLGLDKPGMVSTGIQQATKNLLDRFLVPILPIAACPAMPAIGTQVTYKAIASQNIPSTFFSGTRWVRYGLASGFKDILGGPVTLDWRYTNSSLGNAWQDLQRPAAGFTTSDDVFNKQDLMNSVGTASFYPGHWSSLTVPPGWKVTDSSIPITWYGTASSLVIAGNNQNNWLNWYPGTTLPQLRFDVNAPMGDWRIEGHSFTLTYTGMACDDRGNVNLAQNQKASQSSYFANSVQPTANKAVDGNTNGRFNGGSVTHTGYDQNAWWQVDLSAAKRIESITLWNRTDCCSNRLANFYVFVSKSDMSGKSYNALVNDPTIWRMYVTGAAPAQLDIPAGVEGRYVRVQLSSRQYLSLTEVQVWGK